MLAKILKQQGNRFLLEVDENVNPEHLETIRRGQEGFAEIQFIDNDPRSAKQNALSHSLIKDIAESENIPRYEAKEKMRHIYQNTYDCEFSHAEATKSEMNQWIDFLIEYVVAEGVQLPRRYNYLLEHDSFFYFCCKYRKCAVTGQSGAQIHHVTAVGNRHRNKVDHRKFPFVALSWKYHNIAHNLGQEEFIQKYQIKPVYLDQEALIKIGIMNNAQIMRFDEEYETEDLFKKAVEEEYRE